jgi:hypothetical protein
MANKLCMFNRFRQSPDIAEVYHGEIMLFRIVSNVRAQITPCYWTQFTRVGYSLTDLFS